MKHQDNQRTFKDPVCGMALSRLSAVETYDYQGKTYYFCSGACRERFEAAPGKQPLALPPAWAEAGVSAQRMAQRRFHDCGLSEKLFYTAFLLLTGTGYLMALVYLYTSHEGHDGKPGVSVEDIAENYYGNRSGTRQEAAIRGPMAAYLQQTEDRNQIVAWLKDGASEQGYNTRIRPILGKICLQCHSPASGLKIPELSTYAGIKTVANVDTGESLHTLMKLSHIHLFGIGLVAFGIGLIFRLASVATWLKATLMVSPFVAIFADILAWFLTTWDPVYAYGGGGRRAARAGLGRADSGLAVSALVPEGAARQPVPLAEEDTICTPTSRRV